jgi:hypothetical protein
MVCGLGALAKFEGYEGSLELPQIPADNVSDAEWDKWYEAGGDNYGEIVQDAMLALAEALDVPKLVAIAVIAENDNQYKVNTPEQRYDYLLRWTQRWISKDQSIWTEKNMEGYIDQ